MTAGITFYGLAPYANKAVTVWLAGLDCGDIAVAADGSLFVAYGSDGDGLLTPAFLAALSAAPPAGGWPYPAQIDVTINSVVTRVTVPCVIGAAFTSEGQTLRPLEPNDIKTITGPALGMTRRTHMFGVLVTNTIGAEADEAGIYFGPDPNNLRPANFRQPDNTPLDTVTMFTGVHQDVFDGDYNFDGTLSWSIPRPFPATINAIGGFDEAEER